MAKRRGHGEGSVFERRVDGKVVGYVAMLDLGYVDGRRRRQAFYGKTKAEVRDKLDAAREAKRKGTLPARRVTVEQWLTRWLKDGGPSLRPTTREHYEAHCRLHLIPTLGRIALDRLTPSDVRALLNAKIEVGLSPRSVHHLRAVLRNALHAAERDGLVYRNVAALAEPPHVPHVEMRTLTPDEVRTFQAAIAGTDDEALYITTLSLGLRQGEVLGLRWSDVDLDGRSLRVSQALQRIDRRFVFVEPKSKTSRRSVRLSTSVVELLRGHRAQQNQERLRLGPKWLDLDLVFCGPHGEPLEGTRVTKRFQAILKAAGLPRLRFHDLRHSSASLLLAQGTPARVVMQRLGHSSISLTLGTYSHVIPELEDQAADAMDRVLGG